MVQLCPSPTRTNLPTFPSGNINVWNRSTTPRKFNRSPPQNVASQEEKACLPTIIFQGRAVKPGCVWHFFLEVAIPHITDQKHA